MRIAPTFQAALVAAVFCGCASSTPPNTDVQQQRARMEGSQGYRMDVDVKTQDMREAHDVSIPAVQAFDALPAAYAKLGIPTIAVVDNKGGVYTVGVRNTHVHGALAGTRLSRYIDCGTGAMTVPADSYDVTLSATTYVVPNGAGSTLHTLVSADARDPGDNRAPVHCSSTGQFERQLANLVAGT